MARVTGIGGVFFRARDPQALAAWYQDCLGIDPGATGFWGQDAGKTVVAPFQDTSTYWTPPQQQWMLNFRVDDLDGMLAQLAAKGITAETRAAWDSPQFGRYARLHDPEGNPIELWEPATDLSE